jgi:hypothetical protein
MELKVLISQKITLENSCNSLMVRPNKKIWSQQLTTVSIQVKVRRHHVQNGSAPWVLYMNWRTLQHNPDELGRTT